MIDLDALAQHHINNTPLTPGPGVQAVMARGRRRKRTITGFACSGLIALAVAIGGVVAARDRAETISAVDHAPDGDGLGPPMIVDLDDALAGLVDRDTDPVVVLPTPLTPGWDVEVAELGLLDPFTPRSSVRTNYALERDGVVVGLSVNSESGDLALDGDTVVLDRPQGPVDAVWHPSSPEPVLVWNEFPDDDSGTIVVVRGPTEQDVLEVAERTVFDLRPWVGVANPEPADLDPNRTVLFEGETSGSQWAVSASDDIAETLSIEIDDFAPAPSTTFSGPSTTGMAFTLLTVAKNGTQISVLDLPQGSTAYLPLSDGTRIPLPTVDLNHRARTIGVAPLPPGKAATTIDVQTPSGPVETIRLPTMPSEGWATYRLRLDPSGP
jgi:hypothetical protein